MGAGCGSACLTFGVSTGVSVPDLSRIQDLPEVALVLWWCAPAFLSAFSLCLWCTMLEYGSISRFKGVFSAVYGVCVGLCCLGGLRGLWGFCARVELGGLKACGVFALLLSFLSFFALRFVLFAYLLGLCLCCPLVALLHCLCGSLGVLLFPFPLRTIRKKKGRNSLRPLLSCCELLYLRIAAAFLSATAAALWHSWSVPKKGGICGNSGINTIKQSFKGCSSIFANLNDFIFLSFSRFFLSFSLSVIPYPITLIFPPDTKYSIPATL